MTIAAVLKVKGPDVVWVAPASGVTEVAEVIASRRIGAVVVLDADHKMVGIVSERDVVKAVAAHGVAALRMTAGDLMTRDVLTVDPETSVQRALEIMEQGYFRHLPVVRDGQLVGIVSVRDLVKHQFSLQEFEVETMRGFVTRGAHLGGLR
jgi:CBS domain-containing protein